MLGQVKLNTEKIVSGKMEVKDDRTKNRNKVLEKIKKRKIKYERKENKGRKILGGERLYTPK